MRWLVPFWRMKMSMSNPTSSVTTTATKAPLVLAVVKEQLRKFDGTPLFPERFATTVNYQLSPAEAALYARVTDYVRQEFNRAETLQNEKRS